MGIASVRHQELATSIDFTSVLVPLLSESDLEENRGAEDGLFDAILGIVQRNYETIPARQHIVTFHNVMLNKITSDSVPETNRSKSLLRPSARSSPVAACLMAHN